VNISRKNTDEDDKALKAKDKKNKGKGKKSNKQVLIAKTKGRRIGFGSHMTSIFF
jgi:hypothetical protein